MYSVLILSANMNNCSKLESFFTGEGYDIVCAIEVSQGNLELWQLPSLVLIDTALLHTESGGRVSMFLTDIESTNIPVVAFDSTTTREHKGAPWAHDYIRNSNDKDEFVWRVRNQIDLRYLRSELEKIQKKFSECNRQLDEYNQAASLVQQNLLPTKLPALESFNFAVHFAPCDKVGGDLFNIIQLDENTLMVYLLDISGHGVPSAMVAVAVSQSLSVHTGNIVKTRISEPPYYRLTPPSEVLQRLEDEYPFERFEKFFTICYLLVDMTTGLLTYSNGGHPPPLMLDHAGNPASLYQGGTIVGMGAGMPFDQGEVQLNKGDRVYLYSDGVTEYLNRRDQIYGHERLQQYLCTQVDNSLIDSCDNLIADLRTYSENRYQEDDVTMVGIEYLG